MSLRSRSKPSTSTRALEPAPNVEIPRIQNSDTLLPGWPVVWRANTPGTTPANELERLAVGVLRSEALTVVTAPVSVIFFCTPVPVTATSSSTFSLDAFITTFTVFCVFTNTVCVSMPMYENTMLEYCGIFILNTPSTLVMAPRPTWSFTVTVTPMSGSCCSSVTVPVTSILDCWSCAKAVPTLTNTSSSINMYFFMLSGC